MKLSLTFDDGPNPAATPELLDILKHHQVKATFFMVGQFVLKEPALAKQVAADGHLIGNHTTTHPMLTKISPADVSWELNNCELILTSTVGKHSKMFRPPFIMTSIVIQKIVEDRGLTTVLYRAAGGDATQRGADFIVDKVHKELDGKNGIILLHDGDHTFIGASRKDTLRAVDIMITRYKRKGHEFVSPEEIM